MAVDGGDDVAGLDFGVGTRKGTFNQYLVNLEAVAAVAEVVDETETGGAVGLRARHAAVAAAGMAGVELAQQLAEQLGKVVVVGNVRQEFAIVLGHGVPVDAVHVLVVETGTLLALNVVKHILALGGGVYGDCRREGDGGHLVALGVELLERAAGHHNVLAVGGDVEAAAARSLADKAVFVLAHLQFPKLSAVLTRDEVVEGFAIGREDEVGEVDRHGREADGAVFDAVFLDNDGLCLVSLLVIFLLVLLLVLFGVFLIVFLGALLIVFLGALVLALLLHLLAQGVVFFAETEFVVGILVEEGKHHVGLAAPRGVGAHTVLVGAEEDGVAVEDKAGHLAEVARRGELDNLAVVDVDNCDVGVRIVVVVVDTPCNPLRVGAPGVVEAAVEAGVERAVGELFDLL